MGIKGEWSFQEPLSLKSGSLKDIKRTNVVMSIDMEMKVSGQCTGMSTKDAETGPSKKCTEEVRNTQVTGGNQLEGSCYFL